MSVSSETRLRIIIMMAVLSAGVLALVVQLLRWQVVERQSLLAEADRQHRTHEPKPIPPRRGGIYDRDGFLLAAEGVSYDISATPHQVVDKLAAADRLAPLVGKSRNDIVDRLGQNVPWMLLASRVSCEVGEAVSAMKIPGIQVDPFPRRVYPAGSLAAHVLGFVDSNNTGYYGVEGKYDGQLKGVPGAQQAERDPFKYAIPIALTQYYPPTNGSDLFLTIRRTAQFVADKELKQGIEEFEAESGSVVVLEPRTGAILALANWPDYDPNYFTRTAEINAELFTNPAVSQQYEPGSVFKVVTIAAGLDSGVITPESTVYDSGAVEVGGLAIYDWDRQAHGTVDVTTVLAKSLNVGAAQIAAMMGPERFYNYVRRFGFGTPTGVDLATEYAGVVRTPDDPDWYESYLGTNSFGQGIAVTPLQMVSAVAAVANDGLLMKPYIVDRIVEDGRVTATRPQSVRWAVSTQTAHTLTKMLSTAVDQETTLAQVPGYLVAGKSGTAQIPVHGGYHLTHTVASFAGYLPADDPRMVILVIINKPATSPWGGEVAAPVFARIAQQLVALFDVPPDEVRQQFAAQPISRVVQ
jgi:cell division protein FtsI/penicillin-binding protein 2